MICTNGTVYDFADFTLSCIYLALIVNISILQQKNCHFTMMVRFLKPNTVHGYLLHKMCIMHSALPEICTILYLVYTKRRTDAVGTIDGVLKSLHCISPWRHILKFF